MNSWVWNVILGWLLGIVALPLGSRIMKLYRRDDLKKVIKSEMGSLASILAINLFLIDVKVGPANEGALILLKSVLRDYNDGALEAQMYSSISELDFPSYQAYATRKRNSGIRSALKKITLPFTDSILGELWVYDNRFNQRILFIHNQVSRLNEEIALSMEYFMLTFTVESSTNHAIISQNLDKSYEHIRGQIEDLLKRLVTFLKEDL